MSTRRDPLQLPVRPATVASPVAGGAVDPVACWGIEAFLRGGGTPAAFARVRHRFDPRAEAAPGVWWPGIDLGDDDLSGAELAGAVLIGATLPEVSGSDLRRALLEGATIRRAPGALFDGAELAEADLCFARLEGASFVGANLACCDLVEAGLRRARFDGADLADACFADAELHGATVHLAARLDGADFSGAVGLTPEQRAILAARGAVGLEAWEAA
jgi:hypothetical protein